MKENEIKKVYNLWEGLFISSDEAMVRIGKVLDKREVSNLQIVDINTGEVLAESEKALI